MQASHAKQLLFSKIDATIPMGRITDTAIIAGNIFKFKNVFNAQVLQMWAETFRCNSLLHTVMKLPSIKLTLEIK